MAGSPAKRAALEKLNALGAEDYVVEKIQQGWSIRRICEDVSIPVSSFSRWVDAVPGRRASLARAREAAAEMFVSEVVSIADASQDARLQVDTRKWVASKWAPDTYADKQQPTVQITITAQHLRAARHGDVIDIEPDSAPELT